MNKRQNKDICVGDFEKQVNIPFTLLRKICQMLCEQDMIISKADVEEEKNYRTQERGSLSIVVMAASVSSYRNCSEV